jgi:hypothetical protein
MTMAIVDSRRRDVERLLREFEKEEPAQVDALRVERGATSDRVARARSRADRFSWERSIDGLCAVFERAIR